MDEYERREWRHEESLRATDRVLRGLGLEWPYHGVIGDSDLLELYRNTALQAELVDELVTDRSYTKRPYRAFRWELREIVGTVKDKWGWIIPEHRRLLRPFLRRYFTAMLRLLARKRGDLLMEL